MADYEAKKLNTMKRIKAVDVANQDEKSLSLGEALSHGVEKGLLVQVGNKGKGTSGNVKPPSIESSKKDTTEKRRVEKRVEEKPKKEVKKVVEKSPKKAAVKKVAKKNDIDENAKQPSLGLNRS